MYFKILTFLFLGIFLLSGCSRVPNELQEAEKLMDLQPDSALSILKKISPQNYTVESEKSLYQFLLYQAYDKNCIYDKPDSLIEFPLNYYQKKSDKLKLAICYYFKASSLYKKQKFDESAIFFLKSLDKFSQIGDNEYYKSKIYIDLGDINTIQQDYVKALKSYQLSLSCFNIINDSIGSYSVKLCIARVYRLSKRYNEAVNEYRSILKQTNDSMVIGLTLQDLGFCYYNLKRYVSAQNFFRKSLKFPFYGTSYAIRLYGLADSFFEDEKYNDSEQAALQSLIYPANFVTRRECYRILVNCEYLKNDIKQMGKYMTQYQLYSDSVRLISTQTKCSVIEKIQSSADDSKYSKASIVFISITALILSVLAIYLVYLFYVRYSIKKKEIEEIEKELLQKKQFVSERLMKSIELTRYDQVDLRKNANAAERLLLDKEVYNSCLHLDNWDEFVIEMNISFNLIVEKLTNKIPSITKKEIIWCCLNFFDISHPEMATLLNTSPESLYKLKQRLAKKFNLKNTKELAPFLNELVWS